MKVLEKKVSPETALEKKEGDFQEHNEYFLIYGNFKCSIFKYANMQYIQKYSNIPHEEQDSLLSPQNTSLMSHFLGFLILFLITWHLSHTFFIVGVSVVICFIFSSKKVLFIQLLLFFSCNETCYSPASKHCTCSFVCLFVHMNILKNV